MSEAVILIWNSHTSALPLPMIIGNPADVMMAQQTLTLLPTILCQIIGIPAAVILAILLPSTAPS